MRDRLDALVAIGDDHPHSPLHQIKASSSNPSVGGMKRLLARLEGFSVVRPIDQPPGQSWSRVAPADAPTMRAARMMHSSLTLSTT